MTTVYYGVVSLTNVQCVDASNFAVVVPVQVPVPVPPRGARPGMEWQGWDRFMEPNRLRDPWGRLS
jgi:hypothetical protein